MPIDVNKTINYNPALAVHGDAKHISTGAVDDYSNGVTHYAEAMAQTETLGYADKRHYFATNAPHGEMVKGVRLNAFHHGLRGGMRQTNRNLDISVKGNGYMVVDASGAVSSNTPLEPGLKTTGSFTVDKDGFLIDECGNIALGKAIPNTGKIPQFSVFDELDRVKLPLTDAVPKATSAIQMRGILPADIEQNKSDIRETAVDVWDSLNIQHRLKFEWTQKAPRLWKLEAHDSMGAAMHQNSLTGDLWADKKDEAGIVTTVGGVMVHFDQNGHYAGTLPANTAQYNTWSTAQGEAKGSDEMLDFMNTYVAQHRALTPAGLIDACNNYLNAHFTPGSDEANGAQKTIPAVAVGTVDEVQTHAAAENQLLQTAEKAAETALLAHFDPTQTLPALHIERWLNSAGDPAGSSPSTLSLDAYEYRTQGTDFRVETPQQDGIGVGNIQDITVSKNGVVNITYAGGSSQDKWVLPIVNFPNPDGMTQKSDNVLAYTPLCGTYMLAQPGEGNTVSIQDKALVSSNVNTQKTLIHTQTMSKAARNNMEIYRIAEKLDNYILSVLGNL